MTEKLFQDLGPVKLATDTYVVCDGHVLMYERGAYQPRWPGVLMAPGGQLRAVDDINTAAVKKVKTEGGVDISPESLQLKAIGFHHYLDTGAVWIIFMHRADFPAPLPVLKTTAAGEPRRWVPVAELATHPKAFPPEQYYFDHILNDRPGLLSVNAEWRNNQPVREVSRSLAPASPLLTQA